MTKIDKSRWLRDEANADLHTEALTLRAPGHMTMRAVTALEHKRVAANQQRLLTVWALLTISALVTEPGWLEVATTWALVGGAASWVAWFFIDKHRTKKRVLTVLESHKLLQDLASAERY